MRKLFLFVVLFSMSFLVVGCKDQMTLEEAFEKLNESKNYTMISESVIPNFGTMEITMMINGDYVYMSMLGEEQYTIQKNDLIYSIVKEDDEWVISEITDTAELESMIDVETLEIDMFDKDGDTYTLKEEFYSDVLGEEASALSEFKLVIKKNNDIEITMTMTVQSIEFVTTMDVTDIGSTDFEIPEEVQALVDAE